MLSPTYFMQQALLEATTAMQQEEIPVGAVLVHRNKIIARTHNQTILLHDPTAHAEMLAFAAATQALASRYLTECTLYVTLEPCLMCAGASYWAQIGTIVYAAKDAKNGYSSKCTTALHPKTILQSGLLEHESVALLQSFFQSKRK